MLAQARIDEMKNIDIRTVDRNALPDMSNFKFDITLSQEEEDIVIEIVGYGESDIENGRIQYDTLVAQNLIGLTVGEKKRIITPGGEVIYQLLKLYNSWDDTSDLGGY